MFSISLYGAAENYIIYEIENNPFIDFALNSNDGSMIIKFANSFGQSLSPYSSVLFDSTGLVWFQSIELPSTDTGALCFDIVFEGNLRCLTLTGFTIPTTIGFISGYDVYFATTFQSSSDLCLMRASFTTNNILWVKKSLCSTTGACSLQNSQTVVDSSQNTIYSLIMHGTTGSINPLFVALDTNTGNPKQSVYKMPFICSEVYGIVENLSIIYASAACATSMIIEFDTTKNAFNFYSTTSSQISLRQISYNGVINKIIITGSLSNTQFYSLLATPGSIDQHPDLTNSSYTVIEESVSSTILNYGTLPTFSYSTNLYSSLVNPTPSAPGYTVDNSNTFTSLASYYLEAFSKDGLQSLMHYEEYIDATCAISSTTSIFYSLVQYDGSNPPSWVQFDETNSKLVFTAPRLNARTVFTFGLNSDLGNGKTAIKPIHLTVDAGPPCLVDNCKTCFSNYTNQCDVCASRYSLANSNRT